MFVKVKKTYNLGNNWWFFNKCWMLGKVDDI